ncbi:hypothetical protein BHE74_00023949 [Ensete ventricosum]|nr:hypothetical protein BHE74_00023949 [Ensete ventricosum]RZS02224.1 hypothetical protein BHM03_00032234 [Ensete ventricosum]
MELEFHRNKERFGFLKWGSSAFHNMLGVPPGSGIVHQVNLEYLGRVVFNSRGMLYPDSVVGTDSHTTMIDGLGVAGWGVGGIEAEAAMLGQVKPWIKTSLAPGSGVVDIDFEKEPIGTSKDGKKVYFKDIWPSNEEIANVVQSSVLPDMFKDTYEAITKGNPMWNQLSVPSSTLYAWDPKSTYIHEPPYFKDMTMSPPGPHPVKDAYCLLNFGDSITTDHISPAGSIHKDSPAAKYLMEHGVDPKDFNSYGSRRGNDEVMARGTFANIRLVNKLLKGEVGPKTIHIPSGEKLSVFDAAMVSCYICL